MSDTNACHQGNAIGRLAAASLKLWSAIPALISALFVAALASVWLLILGPSTVANAATCSSGTLFAQPLLTNGEPQPDLLVTDGECRVPPGDYYYGNVNVIHNGRLIFEEGKGGGGGGKTDFWASSIIVEAGGYLYAGAYNYDEPFGTNGGVLTIHLYGKDQSNGNPVGNPGQGVLCRSEENDFYAPCGIPKRVWDDNGKTLQGFSNGISDYFYQYGPLYGDGKCSDGSKWANGRCGTAGGKAGYFGYKTLAVSYGGGVFLRGYKGAVYDKDPSLLVNHPELSVDADPLSSGTSWMRLADGKSLEKGATSLSLERNPLNWAANDEIAVTTTDYLPGHSERLKVVNVQGEQITFEAVESATGKIQWPHNGVRYGGPNDKSGRASDPTENQWTKRLDNRIRSSLDPDLVSNGAETRAAVALLTRSIRIVSAGDKAGQTFEEASKDPSNCQKAKFEKDHCYSFGATTVVRQGFGFFRIQGVEFKQMGQAGRIGHYPVHFHMARKTPASTYVKDSSVNESMTRWIVIHSTQGVTLARNVGYRSIGHGYYLEDGTETDNNFFSNIGIFARAAVDNVQNPRKVPGILAANQKTEEAPTKFPYLSDSTYPSVFWITNGWNNFIGNMAAGAGACGAAYWFVPVWNSDHVEVASDPHAHMKWSGYAGLQNNPDFRGTTPLKTFFKNHATSTMMSFQTTGDAPDCLGVVKPGDPRTENVLKAVESMAPDPNKVEADDNYYPRARGGNRHATRCEARDDGTYDCEGVKGCDPGQEQHCAVTVLDHFTSSFHWAAFNVSAVWLRNQWYLVTNSVLSDVQGGGLTAITGGDYTHSSTIKGYWTLVRNSIFIGHTQPQDKSRPYSSDASPFNQYSYEDSGLRCDWQSMATPVPSNWCLSKNEGVSITLSAHGVAQRLLNIYDGPAYEDSNAFLDITKTTCPNTGASPDGRCIYGTGVAIGVRKDNKEMCYLPNAAIAWKQPNGFFYPPAFHSTNLFFSNVDIRHYVVDPLVQAPKDVEDFGQGGTYLTANSGPNDVKKAYCTSSPDMFNDFTSIDRQTVLNDNDGSLTGLKDTLSINEDSFFSAPVETAECMSNVGLTSSMACSKTLPTPPTARTSPYDYVVTAIASGCSQNPPPEGKRYGRCGDDPETGEGGVRWSSQCSNQNCYGVPLFRQFLTSDERKRWSSSSYVCNDPGNKDQAKCRWPFIRMAGQNMYQRHTLTLDGGQYYIDTSVPLGDNAQQLRSQRYEPFTTRNGPSRNVNVFEPGQTYYVFFLYAKPTTKQTYQIYVGDGFETATIQAVRGRLATAPIKFDPDKNAPPWFKVGEYKDKVVTVTVDFTALNAEQKQKLLPQTKSNGMCGPKTFCDWESATSNKCVSTLVDSGSQERSAPRG